MRIAKAEGTHEAADEASERSAAALLTGGCIFSLAHTANANAVVAVAAALLHHHSLSFLLAGRVSMDGRALVACNGRRGGARRGESQSIAALHHLYKLTRCALGCLMLSLMPV